MLLAPISTSSLDHHAAELRHGGETLRRRHGVEAEPILPQPGAGRMNTRSPMRLWLIETCEPIRLSAPITTPSPIETRGPIRQRGPISARAPITANGPISASAAMRAAGSTTAVGWMPGSSGGSGWKQASGPRPGRHRPFRDQRDRARRHEMDERGVQQHGAGARLRERRPVLVIGEEADLGRPRRLQGGDAREEAIPRRGDPSKKCRGLSRSPRQSG